MKTGWYIGVDFGTTNTYIAAYYKGAKGEVDQFYTNDKWLQINEQSSEDRIGALNNNIPTLATMNAKLKEDCTLNKEILIGQTALEHPFLRIFPDLKSAARQLTPPDGLFGNSSQQPRQYPFGQCSLDTKLQFGNEDNPGIMTVRKLVVEFFKKILHIGEDFHHIIDKNTVQKIVIGCPATQEVDNTTSAWYSETLKGILTECFLGEWTSENKETHEAFKKKIEVEAEPILAGETYLFGDGPSDKNVLVVDIGGGTTDFSIVHYYGKDKTGKLRTTADISASCEIAGNAIDNYIFDLLPDGFQRSKNKCRTAKENLFDLSTPKEERRGVLGLIPSTNNHLFLMPDNKDVSDNKGVGVYNCISFKEGELYLDRERKKWYVKEGDKRKVIKTDDKDDNENTAVGIEQIIYEPIWNKLEKMLRQWRGDSDSDKSIDTIFFVGGTSVIEPLRTYLKGKVDEFFKNSGREITVETLFGANQKTLEVVGVRNTNSQGDANPPLQITCYNAVAIGACISAIGQQCAIKPEVTFKWISETVRPKFEKDKGHIFLQTSGDEVVPTCSVKLSPFELLAYMRGAQEEINSIPITWTVGQQVHQWVIKAQGGSAWDVLHRKIESAGASEVGAAIMLSRSDKNDAQCNFYICEKPDQIISIIKNGALLKNNDIQTVKDLKKCEIPLVKYKESSYGRR